MRLPAAVFMLPVMVRTCTGGGETYDMADDAEPDDMDLYGRG